MFSCRSLWSEKGLQAPNVKGFSGDLLPTLPDGAPAFPSISPSQPLIGRRFAEAFSPFRVLQVPASSVGHSLIGSSLSLPGHRPSRQASRHISYVPSAAHRRFRGDPSLHLKRYRRKNGYIVYGSHPLVGRGLPAERVKQIPYGIFLTCKMTCWLWL
jgi:hypothetical protein